MVQRSRSLDSMFRRTLGRVPTRAPEGLEGDYAVVDAARDPRVYPLLQESRVESACLYDGTLSRAIAEVAPYLVRLDMGSTFVRALYANGWDHAWGIVLRTSAQLKVLRRHLRTLAYARTEEGKKLLFRYYDPRVLRIFLPTCDHAQLDEVFGPIDAFVVDGCDGASPQVLSRGDDGALGVEPRPYAQAAS